ncbi:MAG: nucleotidyltransferase family protein [Fimbriimonadales bacterium]|nr:nucleotidyltransferase family protein [Fimbriimonadales bacterium]
MKTLDEIRAVLNAHRAVLRERYGVKSIAVFGSYARGEATESSDIDLVVQLEQPLGLKFFELWDYLEQALGTPVDLLTPNALNQRPRLKHEAERDIIYV